MSEDRGEDSRFKTINLPRVNNQFIGIGHELELHRKNRRQIDSEQRSIENRVKQLEKEEERARRNFQKKKEELAKIMSVRERQENESEEKRIYRRNKLEELQRLKQQNQYMRVMHKTNLEQNKSMLQERNHSEYSRIRKEKIDGEYRKRMNKEWDLRDKKEHWISLNIDKEKGKMKVDHFYKKKNREHVEEYRSRIQQEDDKINSKIRSIKYLEGREEVIKAKLEQSTLKASRMEELIKGVSRVNSPLDTSAIESELRGSRTRKKEMHIKNSNQTISFTDRQSTTIFDKCGEKGEQVEENIEVEEGGGESKGEFKVVHRKRKNKHANRYKEYEAF